MHPENLKQLRSKTKSLKFGQFGQISRVSGCPNESLHPKILHRYFYTGNLNTFWKFEASMTADKKKWNFDHFGVLHGPKWGAKSKFWSNNISGHGKVSIYWAFENPNSKTEGEVLFSNIGPFWVIWGHNPKTGPKIKISAQQVFLICKGEYNLRIWES